MIFYQIKHTIHRYCSYEGYDLPSITLVPRISARWSRNLWVRLWLRLVFLIVSQIKLGSSESVSIFVQLLQLRVRHESSANQLASALRNHFLCRPLYQRDRKTWFSMCVGGQETDGECEGGDRENLIVWKYMFCSLPQLYVVHVDQCSVSILKRDHIISCLCTLKLKMSSTL